MKRVRVAVVGAGVNGLCAAWHLSKRLPGDAIGLFDALPPGHDRGSSHGEERIIRSSYETAAWVRAMVRARGELWPALEADLGERLIVDGPAVFWGPEDGPLPAYADAVRAVGVAVDELDVATARRRFPTHTFAGAERVLHDRTAGVIAAGRTIRALEARLAGAGVARIQARVTGVEDHGDTVRLLGEAPVEADAVLIAAGPWVRELAPSLADRTRPARQHVGYWRMDVSPGRTPAWVHLGREGLHYGLPTFDGRMKAAFHATGSGDDDPDELLTPDPEALDRVEAHLRAWFEPGPGERLGADRCFYTNAPDDAFVIEPLPGHDRALVVSACSGHAFKLAPWVGEQAAEWAVGRLG